jgi:very-short-patch-repair endonuclease
MIVETDGRETHETPTAFQDDRRRDQFLAAAGYRVLRVTWNQIHGDTAGVLDRISRALRPDR